MKNKKLICLILAFLLILMTSCSSGGREQPNVTQSPEEDIDYSGVVLTVQDTMAGNDFVTGLGELNYQVITQETGIRFRSKCYLPDEIILKMLAGDDDIDIYFISNSQLHNVIDCGFYTFIESEIIDNYISQCRDILQEYSTVDGKTAFMPVGTNTAAILIPKSAIEETGVTAEDIEYLDDFLAFVRNYDGDRIAYTNSSSIFDYFESQYEMFYCDYENKEANFETPLYMHIYEEIWGGWQDSDGKIGATLGFEHNLSGDYSNNSEHALCTFGYYSNAENFTDERLNSDPDVYKTAGSTDFFEKWRAFPIPKISEDVTCNADGGSYAIINPYSKNKEAALKVLELLASDYFKYSGNAFSGFVYEDKAMYPESYHPDSEIFNDFLNIINSNNKIAYYTFSVQRLDIDDYQAGKLTLEEAVAEYQRQVDIWLNE